MQAVTREEVQQEGEQILVEEITQREKIRTRVFQKANDCSIFVAKRIAKLIKTKTHVVLGLATGSTPLGVYNALIQMHKEEHLSFKNVHTFNLDEYHGLPAESIQSYRRFMNENLFFHVDIPLEQTNVPDGSLSPELIKEFAKEYESKINSLGGIDLQLLGIGDGK